MGLNGFMPKKINMKYSIKGEKKSCEPNLAGNWLGYSIQLFSQGFYLVGIKLS
jgi:hypothetical protein